MQGHRLSSTLQGPDANQPKHEHQRKVSSGALIFLSFAWDLACSLENKLNFMSSLNHKGFNFWKWDYEACLKRLKEKKKKRVNMLNTTEDRTEWFIYDTSGGHRSFLRLPNLRQIPNKISYYSRMTSSDMNIRIVLRTSLRDRGIHVRVSKGTNR